jgi:ATP-dependent DNA helicase RecG
MTAPTPRAPSNAERISYPAALSILEQALQAERRRNFDDGSVKGGLDRLLARLHDEQRLPPGSPLARAVGDLAKASYASLAPAGRAQWIGTLGNLLDRERARIQESILELRDRRSAAGAGSTSVPRKPASTAAIKSSILLNLDSPVTALSGVNRPTAAKLSTLGITTLRDLLYHFPHRYDDFSTLRSIAQLVPGEQQTLIATVWSAAEKRLGRRSRATELIIGDKTGNLRVVFFNQPYLSTKFKTGATVVLSGRVSVFHHQRQMDSPEWELLPPGELERAIHTGRLVPVYPLTAGLSARTLRRIMHQALSVGVPMLAESLPAPVRERHRLIGLTEAVQQAHYPDNRAKAEAARRRLAFEELLALQLAVLKERKARLEAAASVPLPLQEGAREAFLQTLPFDLTRAQRRVAAEIDSDLTSPLPMARLLQGDVGSGKTVVAALALLAAVENGLQAVLMAPTEILAEQHFRTLCALFRAEPDLTGPAYRADPPYLKQPLRIALLHGGMGTKAKTLAQQALSQGDVQIAVGTQALIQERIQIPKLGLAIVDEQHRFGVAQRAALRDKGINAHLLVMTATPIPRTLALTLYGDLETSVIDEMPPGRKPISTKFIASEQREFAYRFLRDEIDAGRQAFVICPLVEESEKLETKAAVEEYERLRSLEVFKGVSIGLLHGRMRPTEKDEIMSAFASGRTQILVSTAVVEVGIDVPNASVILIEGADRFGLAQLHQFRGRVGRGADRSYCLLLADNASEDAGERLRLMEETQDGFELAEADLRLRGPGEYFGTRQSGMPELRVASLTDVALLTETRDEAAGILADDDSLESTGWKEIRARVEQIRSGGGEVS